MKMSVSQSSLYLRFAIILTSVVISAANLSANDGREFYKTRPANNPGGKALSATDVVFNRELVPHVARKYYDFPKAAKYPMAMTLNNQLWYYASASDSTLVAESADGIVYGEAVSRHEFGIDGGIFLSPDRTKLAFYRKDESKVAQFPLLDITASHGALDYIRYPMAGCASETITLGVYDHSTGKTQYLQTAGELGENHYLTNITWGPDSKIIYVQMLDRKQQNMHLNAYDAATGEKIKTILTESSNTWVEPQYPLYWIKGSANLCIYSTDNRDGYWNLYLLDTKTDKVKRLANVDRDMTYLANDGKYVYYTGPDFHPVNNYLWRANIKTGKVEQLTKEEGWHSIIMAPDFKSYIDVYERLDMSPVSRVKDIASGKVIKTLSESEDPTKDWAYTEITMSTVTSANGSDLNYYRMVKPANFDPSKKYPLILYVYGGPHSQLVTNTFLGGLRRWEMYAAQKGFVVFVMDGRGTQRHSAAYEHAIYRQCGQCEMADQMQAIAMLKDIPWIDEDRIGVYGWSYGGFMSLSLTTNNPETFKVSVAGGPVIDWKWYEVMYGERYMSTPQDNPEGFAKTSLLNKAGDLKARTLVIEGGIDDTVVPLHALSFIQACINKGIKIEYFTYPKAAHNMRGTDRVHLVEKITDFFIENL